MSSSPPRPSDSGTDTRRAKARRKLRRRASGTIVLLAGLVMAGVLASVLTPDPQVAVADESNAAMINDGRKLYETSCITCHGANLQGVVDRGPALLGVGDAAVYFQVSTGRMPAARGEAQAQRKPAKFTTEQIDQLGAFIQAEGGGPQVPRDANGEVASSSLRGDSIGRGSELFRLNCASCHNFTGRGGALSSGKYAPVLDGVDEAQIYTAMLTGPQNMPKFSNRQLNPEEKKDIIAYVKYVTEAQPSGGLGLGGFGPVSEGMVMWFVGVIAIVAGAMWMGSRA
ncbi:MULTISPECIES: cytochrome bc1 complex diheme cytochrome c subunit [Gordonia]|jgi:ubiquinol-cytochrome c reductase cytochrome c subunit|uniref:Cytochrome bc1 complex cytochrome c subunit n=2 Tax=Gordonia alkanivorans TaxID=84096 RepID=F9VPW8_9ACTN|nr:MULTISPECIES: cytochrome c [Gordonia]AZZ81751.1 cytochrome C [Gordonia alkanivorans]ETA05177.1 cytochrome C [Gordonia alkanivorans CGMCC 6845]MDH3007921.1 cytochrome c [Gordonia alkanivorans]MDH3011993.1 cytochrome c [Gordonia alkanivorans]MDH3016718.1 cytochrome c [Gordonia alkanivorans]